MARNIKTTTLEAIEHELDVAWIEMHTAPQDEMQTLFDLAMAAKESAKMYEDRGFPFIASEYMARARAYGRRWKELNSEARA